MQIGDRIKAWRETEEWAEIVSLESVCGDGTFMFWIRFDGDAEDDLFLYALDPSEHA